MSAVPSHFVYLHSTSSLHVVRMQQGDAVPCKWSLKLMFGFAFRGLEWVARRRRQHHKRELLSEKPRTGQ